MMNFSLAHSSYVENMQSFSGVKNDSDSSWTNFGVYSLKYMRRRPLREQYMGRRPLREQYMSTIN